MRDIPPDILAAAYGTAAELRLPADMHDLVALAIAQAVFAERERAARHASMAVSAIRNAGDGSVERITRGAIAVIEATAAAIRGGAQ